MSADRPQTPDDVKAMVAERSAVGRNGLVATSLDADEIDTGHVGNFTAELFAGQGLLGGFFGLNSLLHRP